MTITFIRPSGQTLARQVAKGLRRCASLCAAVLLVTSAHAGQTSGTVDGWQLMPDGGFSFHLYGGPALCGNGTANDRGAVVAGVRGLTPDGVKAMYSTIMAVFLAGKRVTVYTDEAVRSPGWGCTVYALDVAP